MKHMSMCSRDELFIRLLSESNTKITGTAILKKKATNVAIKTFYL